MCCKNCSTTTTTVSGGFGGSGGEKIQERANFKDDFKEMNRNEFLQALLQVIYYIKYRF